MSEFTPGFSARHHDAAAALQRAFAPPGGFAVADPRPSDAPPPAGPVSFAPQAPVRPKHFSPADPDRNPTAGWDPLDPTPTLSLADQLAAARDSGYAEGVRAAQLVTDANAQRDRALLTGLAEALAAGGAFDRERMARQLRQTVLFLVAKLVGEVGIAPDRLAGRIEAATDLLADSAESAMLRVHPDDVPLLEGRLPDSVFAVGDAGVARGSFVLEAASTIVEDGPEHWLEQLAHAVDGVAVPC